MMRNGRQALRNAAWKRVALYAAAILFAGPDLPAQVRNGFDLSNALVPVEEIHAGGPPRDGIPSIDEPRFQPAGEIRFLSDSDLVFGVGEGRDRRAYPLRILVWHELVNDVVGGRPLVISYCPLCGTAMAFDRRVRGRTLTFGVSGLLYQSDVLMYDRETESLWTQLGMECVSGSFADEELAWIPGELMTWEAWREQYPDSQVLTTDTGYRRNYGRMPYQGYEERPGTLFPVPTHRRDLEPKAWIGGLLADGVPVAFSLEELARASGNIAEVELAGQTIRVHYDPETRRLRAADEAGEQLPAVQAYWFAWQAFYPETKLWEGPESQL